MKAERLAQATMSRLIPTSATISREHVSLLVLHTLADVLKEFAATWRREQLPMHKRGGQDSSSQIRAFHQDQADFYGYFVDLMPRLTTPQDATGLLDEIEARCTQEDGIAVILAFNLYCVVGERLRGRPENEHW